MKTETIEIKLENGLDARPVALLVQEASKYDSRIYVEADGKRVNAKSIMGIMAFNPKKGMAVNIVAEGSDEVAALTAMEDFLVCG